MIYNEDSVIRQTAQDLNLIAYRGEPLHIDAIFTTTKQWDWFPINVAIEHENDPRGFHGEINKLISVRSSLKIGITYSIIDDKPMNYVKKKLKIAL